MQLVVHPARCKSHEQPGLSDRMNHGICPEPPCGDLRSQACFKKSALAGV